MQAEVFSQLVAAKGARRTSDEEGGSGDEYEVEGTAQLYRLDFEELDKPDAGLAHQGKNVTTSRMSERKKRNLERNLNQGAGSDTYGRSDNPQPTREGGLQGHTDPRTRVSFDVPSRQRRESSRPFEFNRLGRGDGNFIIPGRNHEGGILFEDEEIELAFNYLDYEREGILDVDIMKTGPMDTLLKNNELTEDDFAYHFLKPKEPYMTLPGLKALLKDNLLNDFDPVAEAFKLYDPLDTGYIDEDVLCSIFQDLGFGELSDEDLQFLIRLAGAEDEGRINMTHFRNMLVHNTLCVPPLDPKEQQSEHNDGWESESRSSARSSSRRRSSSSRRPRPPSDAN